MRYNAQDIAKYIVSYFTDKDNAISHLKLQKLMYFLWVDYYRECSEYLFDENLCAWRLGPVVPSVYGHFCVYGSMPIVRHYDVDITPDDKVIIDKILDRHGKYSARDLVNKTHEPGTPWSQTYDAEFGTRPIIPFELIISEELN